MRHYTIVFIILNGRVVATLCTLKHKRVFQVEGTIEYDSEPGSFAVSVDPLAIIYTLRSLLNRLLAYLEGKRFHITGVSVVTHFQGWMAWDKQSGLPILPFVSLNDPSLDRYVQRLKYDRLFQDLVQNRFEPQTVLRYWALAQVFDTHLADLNIPKRRLIIASIDSWILYHLTGKKVCKLSKAHGFETGVFDNDRGRLDPAVVQEIPVVSHVLDRFIDVDHDPVLSSQFIPLPDHVPITMNTFNGCCIDLNHRMGGGSVLYEQLNHHSVYVTARSKQAFAQQFGWTVRSNHQLAGSCAIDPPPLSEWMVPESDQISFGNAYDQTLAFVPTTQTLSLDQPASWRVFGVPHELSKGDFWVGYWKSVSFLIRRAMESLNDHHRAAGLVMIVDHLVHPSAYSIIADCLQMEVIVMDLAAFVLATNQFLIASLGQDPGLSFALSEFGCQRFLPTIDPISSLAYYNEWKQECHNMERLT